MMGLTRKQRELLDLIGERMAVDGVAPSFEEMKNAMGLKSKSGIARLIDALEHRGFITRLPHRARAIEILDTPRPVLTPVRSRPYISAPTDALIAELLTRGYPVGHRSEQSA